MADYSLGKTPGGKEYWIVRNWKVVDEYPKLLESMMPIFLDIEPIPNKARWDKRIKDLEEERELRKANKNRTVEGNG